MLYSRYWITHSNPKVITQNVRRVLNGAINHNTFGYIVSNNKLIYLRICRIQITRLVNFSEYIIIAKC